MSCGTRDLVLIVTCDQPPLPPLNGTSKKVHDLLRALAGDVPIHALVYPGNASELEALRQHWSGTLVTFHPLRRRAFAPHVRSTFSRQSLPTVTRDFKSEAALIRELMHRDPASRLVIDFISGAPLVREFARGVVISGHDCMSHLFAEEARRAPTWRERAHFELRRAYARRAERRYYRLADAVHVVSEQDARELRHVDSAIRTTVIPIASEVPLLERLTPIRARHERVIWGNLASPVILAGLRELLSCAARRKSQTFRDWVLVGRVPVTEAMQRLPELAASGLTYVDAVPCVSDILGRAEVVLLPDLGGTGQKNRTLDALAHGACVIGLSEVFRGIAPTGQYVEAASCDAMLDFVEGASPDVIAEFGLRARACADTFSVNARGRQWRELLESLSPLVAAKATA